VQARHSISFDQASALLTEGQLLANCYVSGELKIETGEVWEKEVVFQDCIFDFFSGSTTQFEKPVRLMNCHFKKCQFIFSYFLGGLTIDNCTFDDYLDFQAGGHNKGGKPIIITGNQFAGFVNFFDCWYESEIIIRNNNFQKGTNVLGKPFNIPVTFDVAPLIENNKGRLDYDTEDSDAI
jgi:hypothetical protein